MDTNYFYDLIYKTLEIIESNKTLLTAIFSGSLGGLLFLGLFPLSTKDDATTGEIISAGIRRALLLTLFIFLPLTLLYVYVFSTKITGDSEYFKLFFKETIYGFRGSWALYVAIFIGTLTFKFSVSRIVKPYISYLIRKYRVKQTNQKIEDIRELFNDDALTYDPRDYYKLDTHIFHGLDSLGKPVYELDEEFRKKHVKVVGPTQTGKGVWQGVVLDQVIKKGWQAGFLDIKPDDFIESIMFKSCKEAGREPPIVVDLNGIGPGSYGMFANGSMRNIIARIQYAFNINETGTNADFYNVRERSLMLDVQKGFDGTLSYLEKLFHEEKYYEITEKSRAAIKEFKMLKSLNPKKGRGFSIDKTLKANRCFIIKGSVDDPLVKKAQTMFLMDLVQSVLRMGKQTHHVFLAVDEVKFAVSQPLAAGLSTVLSKGLNMSVSYQTPQNLLSLEDKRLNADAIKSEIETNTLTSIIYKAENEKDADVFARNSGTRNKRIVGTEEVEYDDAGAEKYTGKKQIRVEQENVITSNRFLSFPARVAGFYRPGYIAQVLYTCWIPLETNDFIKTCVPKEERETQGGTEENTLDIDDDTTDIEEPPQDEAGAPVEDIMVYGRASAPNPKPRKKTAKSKQTKTDSDSGDYSFDEFLKEAGIE